MMFINIPSDRRPIPFHIMTWHGNYSLFVFFGLHVIYSMQSTHIGFNWIYSNRLLHFPHSFFSLSRNFAFIVSPFFSCNVLYCVLFVMFIVFVNDTYCISFLASVGIQFPLNNHFGWNMLIFSWFKIIQLWENCNKCRIVEALFRLNKKWTLFS